MAAKKKDKKWIQKAVKKKGALTKTAKRDKGMTKKGTIKVSELNKLAKKPGKTGQRARLAKTLRKINKK